jgi:arylsulfatase A-like enzyme
LGKWHLGFGDRNLPGWDDVLGPDYNRPLKPGPNDLGFDYFWGFPHVGQYPHILIENDRVLNPKPEQPIRITPDPRPGFEKDYLRRPRSGLAARLGQQGPEEAFYEHEQLSDRLTGRAVKWIDDYDRAAPFLLYFAHRNIHGPLIPAKRFEGTSEIGVRGDFIHEMDWSVGQILDALQRNGYEEDTWIVFSSDNGGVHQYRPLDHAAVNGHALNGPLRGQKTSVYEGGHRVPLISKWPGQIPPGTTDDTLVALTDLMASFAAFFSVDLPEDAAEDSFNVLGPLLGKPGTAGGRPHLVSDSFSGLFSIRQGPWKLILGQGGGGARAPATLDPDAPPLQLYHLGRDLDESDNLFDRHPERVGRLTALLEQIRRTGRSDRW